MTLQWARDRGIPLTRDAAKEIGDQCAMCLRIRDMKLTTKPCGHLRRGGGPGTIWQIDYTDPLPREGCKQYALNSSCYILRDHASPPVGRANQAATLEGLSRLILAYGIPETIQSDQGSHFTGQTVQRWAKDAGILWTTHIPYNPQAAGLIERYNGILKEQIRKLTPLKGWTKVLNQTLLSMNTRPQWGDEPIGANDKNAPSHNAHHSSGVEANA